MKKLLTLLVLLIAVTGLWAQPTTSDFFISGTITDTSDNSPVANHIVLISESLNNGVINLIGSVTTNSSGYYSYIIVGGSTIGPNRTYYIQTDGCQNTMEMQVFQNGQGTIDAGIANFSICDLPDPTCSITLTATQSDSATFVFNPTATGTGPFTYYFDFDDNTQEGFISILPVSHTYTTPGTYNVCVTAYSSDGCTSVSCTEVTVTSGNPNGGNCQSSYTYTYSQGVYTFTALNNSNTSTYTWVISGISFLTGINETVFTWQWDTLQPLTVCLETNNNNGCVDTYCETMGGTTGCDATFSFTPANVLNGYYFIPETNSNSYSHNWDFGDGEVSTNPMPFHEYTSNGTYNVCHTLFDNNGCQDTECLTVAVNDTTNNGNCQAYFTYTPANPNNSGDLNINFTDQSASPSGNITTWSWTFGDGTSSTLQNPSHDYVGAGSYLVCLSIWNDNGCQSQTCDTVIVGGNNIFGNVTGLVFTDNNSLADEANTFLLRFDYANNEILPQAIGSTVSGGYVFTNVPNGDYIVKAALTANDPLYALRIPTYHTNAEFWFDADVITVNNDAHTANIYMSAATNPGGPGFIGGSVDWADTLRASFNFSGATVILQNLNGDNIAYTIADANGEYSFTNIAYGTYNLYADFAGFTGNPTTVTISANTPSVNDAQVLLGPSAITSVQETSVIDGISLYPNPTIDIATLVVATSIAAQLNLTIVNMVGQVVDSQTVNAFAGKNMVQLNTDGLAQGVYTIVLRDSKGVAKAQRLIKQ
jgi:PKD repeat protein